MKIKCSIDYPWAGIEPDEEIIELEDNLSEKEISDIAYETCEEIVWNRLSCNWRRLDEK